VDGPIAPGLTTFGFEWARLYNRLNKHKNIIAGDYKEWDGKLMPDVQRMIGRATCSWYGDDPEGNRIRMAIIETLINMRVNVANKIYPTSQGLPSGVPITAPFNSLCNWGYMLCAIFELAEAEDIDISPQDIEENVEETFYGDDHVISVSDRMPWFNFRNYKKVMDKHLIGYTDSIKSDRADFDYEALTDVTYLKRKFVPKTLWKVLSPLDYASITKQMNWVRIRQGCGSPEDMLKEHFGSFGIELHQHGEDVFNDTVKQYNDFVKTIDTSESILYTDTYINHELNFERQLRK